MFVELTPTVLVDPAEVAVVTDHPDGGSRIYLRGSGFQQYLVVDRPVAEVALALLSRPRVRPSTRDALTGIHPDGRRRS
ncbi:hypothetical protein F9L07_28395 [Pimelobacter simplex]|uniref:Uncharacterized protein n=1 Tax=Nocardioides simplex TaxID=2045 RepID=A0A7J5DQJ7_NOCSI|nr:hypothetical protein [Pimelobacter simplex]KAB2806955.1 hypothetical protein F9L07_28395 [Pimelobacter simplex]